MSPRLRERERERERERRELLERQERRRQRELLRQELRELRELRDELEPREQLERVERLARLERERLQLEQQEQGQNRQIRLERERERRERERRERKRERERERERREREREQERERERRAQLLQQLKAPPGACPGGLSLNHLSSLLFLLVLSALALALLGWFLFLGLLLTILAYLLLAILPESPQNVEPCSNPGVPGRNATFIRGTRSAGALAAFLPHVAVLAANERIHRVASLVTRCMDSGRNPASYGFTRLFRTGF